MDERTDRSRTLCLCLPVWPGGLSRLIMSARRRTAPVLYDSASRLCLQNISSLQKWAETSCEIIKNSAMFEECREVVSNVDEFYANCVYDSCRSLSLRRVAILAIMMMMMMMMMTTTTTSTTTTTTTTDFATKWHKQSTEQGDETINSWGQEVKGQDHTD